MEEQSEKKQNKAQGKGKTKQQTFSKKKDFEMLPRRFVNLAFRQTKPAQTHVLQQLVKEKQSLFASETSILLRKLSQPNGGIKALGRTNEAVSQAKSEVMIEHARLSEKGGRTETYEVESGCVDDCICFSQ